MKMSLKRSEIDKNLELKNKILGFINENSLNLDWVSNFKQIIFHYNGDLKFIPKCYCGGDNSFKSSIIGYRKTCSFKCSNSSSLKKHKINNTKLERYGDMNYNNPSKMMNTKLERYGDVNYNNRESAKETCLRIYGHDHQLKNDKVKQKVKDSKFRNHGDTNYNNIDKIKDTISKFNDDIIKEICDKVKMTKLERWGDENYNNPKKMILTKIRMGIYKDPESSLKYVEYRGIVRSRTNSVRKKILEDWNGYDYYDGEYIKDNFKYEHTNDVYPTIDHKIPISWGYKNGVSIEVISHMDNLCVTKRSINYTKGDFTEEEFNLLL